MGTRNVSEEKKQVVMNLYISGIGEEFIAMQLDLNSFGNKYSKRIECI